VAKQSSAARVATVLVGIDFSDAADHALDVAIDLARGLGARTFALVHVHHAPPIPAALPGNASGEVWVAIEEQALQAARDALTLRARRVEAAGFTPEVSVRTGSPAEALCEAARECEADLVVIGTHGRSGLAHVLLGSVAERTVERAPCPVLTVRSPEHGDEG
jgi:nucleotide-binding universal stress UspA family protein